MTPVASSAFSHVAHDARTQALDVRFHSGAVHRYTPVSKGEFEAMMRSGSLGRHFTSVIKPAKLAMRIS
jgi:hypothetical protein